MTWTGRCKKCRGWLFTLQMSSGGWVNVHCADPECSAYIGQITKEMIGSVLEPETLIAEAH